MNTEIPKSLETMAQEGLAALRRARRRAERVALATGTYLVDAVDGKPVIVAPRSKAELDAEDARESHEVVADRLR